MAPFRSQLHRGLEGKDPGEQGSERLLKSISITDSHQEAELWVQKAKRGQAWFQTSSP